jgi:tetratricopeptide (TPR) repeat protein
VAFATYVLYGRSCLRKVTGAAFAAAVLYVLLIPDARAQERDLSGKQPALSAEETHRIEELRKEATETLARGDMEQARHEFEEILKTLPYDASAERDAARAAEAAGRFEYAAEALEKAHHFGGHEHDPELHYLRGEALYTLGRDEEAAREQKIAELEIGSEPKDRMQKLWLARIYARRGYVVLADRIYETMLPPAPQFDTEVALNQADAHLMNKDWKGGVLVLRRYLALDPKNVRGREMMAWAQEADGDLDGELAVRRSLVDDQPTAEHQRDYGRALERAANYRAASREYRAALDAQAGAQGVPDATLVTSYDRMHYRVTPELSGAGQLRSDPQAWSWRLQAGGAVPFGPHHQAGVLVWHDDSTDHHANQVVGSNVLRESGSVTGLGAYVMFAHRVGASALLGADTRFSTTTGEDSQGHQVYGPNRQFSAGANAEVDSPIAKFAQINLHGDLHEQWNDAPVTVHEGGQMSGVTGHLYLFPRSRVVLFDTGVQERHLTLRPLEPGQSSPASNQTLVWGGVDFNLWTDAARVVRGEALDERMVRRTALNDAGVLAYRHYELWASMPEDFFSRIALYPRASIDNGSLILRKVVAGGRMGVELHGGLGWERYLPTPTATTFQNQVLAQGGAVLAVASTWSTRLMLTYDIVHQTTIGLPGTLQIGWVSFHADL